jgi:hypothetical protein
MGLDEYLTRYEEFWDEGPPPPKEKPVLKGLFRDNPKTPEGKYLVKRRDGSVVEFPTFVLGARDEMAAETLRFYASLCEKKGLDPGFVAGLRRWADTYDAYRAEHGDGDPGMGQHRVDDPATIEEMKKGMSA